MPPQKRSFRLRQTRQKQNSSSDIAKKASCRNRAETYPDADQILVETIKKALADYKNVSMIRFTEPARIETTFYRTDFCENVLSRTGPEVRRRDARTLEKTVAQIKRYADLKI